MNTYSLVPKLKNMQVCLVIIINLENGMSTHIEFLTKITKKYLNQIEQRIKIQF